MTRLMKRELLLLFDDCNLQVRMPEQNFSSRRHPDDSTPNTHQIKLRI